MTGHQATLLCRSGFSGSHSTATKKTCLQHQQKLYTEGKTHILNLPFPQKVQILSFLDVTNVSVCSEVCRAMSGNLLQRALSFIEQNLFLHYQKELKMRKYGQRKHLGPESVAKKLDDARFSNTDKTPGTRSLCSISNIWRLSRKLFINAKRKMRVKAKCAKKLEKKLEKLEGKCLRTAVVTWFNVNHDYLQEKSVCVPADYIEDGHPHMQLHWRKLIVEWLFEFPDAFGVTTQAIAYAINLFDRYLCIKKVSKHNLQLCAIGCLLVASDTCDSHTIEMFRLVTLAEGSYTLEQIKSMRIQVETQLGKLCVVTCFHYLPQIMHYVSHLKKSPEIKRIATEYLTLFLAAYASLRYSPALIAISAVAVALQKLELIHPSHKNKQVKTQFIDTMILLTRFTQSEIQECTICGFLSRNIRSNSENNESY